MLAVDRKQMLRIVNCPIHLGQKYVGVRYGPDVMKWDIPPTTYAKQTVFINHIPDEKKTIDEQLKQLYWYTSKIMAFTEPDDFTLYVGGDHSISIATIQSVLNRWGFFDTGVVWFDSGLDAQTRTSCHRRSVDMKDTHDMSVASLLGYIAPHRFGKQVLNPRNLVYIGARSWDKEEMTLVKDLGIKVFTTEDVRRLGMTRVMQQTTKHLEDCSTLHLSFDVDALDPSLFMCTGSRFADGISFNEALILAAQLARTNKLRSMDIVEFNPMQAGNNVTEVDECSDIISYIFTQVLINRHL